MSMRHHRTLAAAGVQAAHSGVFKRSVLGACIALLLAGPAFAQDETAKEEDQDNAAAQSTGSEETTELDAIEVTGIRASVYKAQDIKRDAETFVDSMTALDIGALPDRSVTETLSRIPGVTIDHFLSVGDPEHFSAEGNGVQVRGLTQVRSELNGRDSFSASGGRSLSFQDVPSELMSGVDVFKNQTASMIEGGLGGTVNLRTFMPFDFDGKKVGFTLSENYGDFVEKWKPSASALFSNRWDTEHGEFGILLDLAHSELATRTDGMFVRPFFKTSNSDLNGDGTNEALWTPRGADWRTLTYERQRDGAYLAMQWRPSSDVELYATAFQSKYDELWNEDAIFVGNDPTQVRVDASQPYEFDGNVFRSGRLTQDGGVPMGTDIRASNRKSKTADYSVGLKWVLSETTDLTSELQYITADTRGLDSTVSLGVNVPYIDVSLGGVPSIGVDQGFTSNPANYYWGFTMDHQDDNTADEIAWRADLAHYFNGDVLQSVKFGVRFTDRDATNINTGYNWKPVFQPWMQWWALPGGVALPSLDLNSTVNSDWTHLNTFQNFFRGDANTPGGFYAPILATALGYPTTYEAIHSAADPFYTCCYAGTYSNTSLDEEKYLNQQNEQTQAAYLMVNFAAPDMRLDGNVGVRVVRTENAAAGHLVYPNVVYAPYLGSGQSEPIVAENSYTDVLPSANLKWEVADNVIVRFAASKAIARPAFSDMQAYQTLSANVIDGITPPDDGSSLPLDQLNLTGDANGNPYLEPMKANQFDLSLEWYFDPDHGGMAWINLFHKDIKDYFRRQTELVGLPGVDGNTYDYLITRPVNVGTAKIQGAEIGWNQFFDFLPAPFDGLGMSANYTYIDSSTNVPAALNAQPVDTDGSTFGELPADGLSKNSYNLALFYEKGPWQVRFAYNWRNDYLLSVGPNGYNGGDGGIAWKLPVFSDEFGQLDGSVFYRINERVQIGLEMNNINNAEQRTYMMQNGAGDHITSWYVNDRRYAATVRVSF